MKELDPSGKPYKHNEEQVEASKWDDISIQEFMACMSYDAFRAVRGVKTQNFNVRQIIRWLELLHEVPPISAQPKGEEV